MNLSVLAASTALALTTQSGAHVHGSAELLIGVDGDGRVEIQLIAPGHDIYGFEHAARSAQEEAAVAEAHARLADGAGLFELSGGRCEIGAAQIEADQHDDHDEDHHDHDEDHEHHDHDDHDDHHGDDHGSVHVTWSGHCEQAERISTVQTGLFDYFDHLEQIDVVFVAPGIQTADRLTPTSARAQIGR